VGQALTTPPIGGHCDAQFRAVHRVFTENFTAHEEIGAALCVIVGRELVIDLHGGFTDESHTTPWQPDTLVNVYSLGKGILAVLTLILVEHGLIELDAPVGRYWPEFAAHGKGALTVRGLLAHRAGLPAVRRRLPENSMLDWGTMCDALAGQAPFWTPNQAHGYHVNTYGFLIGELVRRATGLRVGEAVRRYVSGPLEVEFYFGVPASEHHRIATVCRAVPFPPEPDRWAEFFPPSGDAEHDLMIWHTYLNPRGLSGAGIVNTPEWRLGEVPSANGHATARAVASVYAAFLAGGPPGVRWVGAGLRAEAATAQSDGNDLVLGRRSRFGLGFQLPHPERTIGPNPHAFGHFGYGGTLGFADPDARLAFGFVSNHPSNRRWYAPRTQRLLDAVYATL
jgi:CubicO group peptidase (beta-lactamase class C family)